MLGKSVEAIRYSSEKFQRIILLIILILMSTAGLLGSDIYLPGMPVMASLFEKNMSSMQWTLSIYLLGLSVGQLIIGPLTDRMGRKKLALWGMGIYGLASLGCAYSGEYGVFTGFRLLQAIGACSGLVIGRAIVSDLFDSQEAGKLFSTIFPFVGVSPALAPLIGGFLFEHFGWQSSFLFVAGYAFLSLMLILIFLNETLSDPIKDKIDLGGILKNYSLFLFDKKFMGYALCPCAAYLAYFAYLSQSPFVFYERGHSTKEIGFFYITLSISYILGNKVGKKALSFYSIDVLLYRGYLIFNLGALLLLISWGLSQSLIAMVFSMSVLTFGNGILIPLGTAGALHARESLRGSASGLLGFLQLGCAALSSSLIGHLSQNSVIRLSVFIAMVTAAGLISFWLLNKKWGLDQRFEM